MTFTPIWAGSKFGRTGGEVAGGAYSGSAFVTGAFTYSLAVTGSPPRFGLVSVDLAEYSLVVSDPVAVRFVGYRFDGSIVTTDFTTDGVIDGTGPLADFQAFYFDSRFADVLRVEVPRAAGPWTTWYLPESRSPARSRW